MPELVVLTEQLLAPVPGGTGRYTRELAAALAEAAPPGWTVTGVTARHGDLAAAEIAGVRGPRPLALPRRALTLAWEHGLPPWPGGDVVHAPTPLAPPARGGRLVVTVHDTVPFTHPETLTSRGAAWHRKVIRRAAATAAAIVVPTEAVAAELAVHAPGPAPVHVIGHGVTAALSAPTRTRLDLPGTYVLAVGTVEPRKGLDVLVEAMAEVPGAELVVAGPPGWGAVDLPALAAAHGVTVRMLGRLSDEDLAAVLRRASVLAVPSRAEGFGLPLLEAMAAGVPVVHSDAPALVEVAGGAGVQAKRDDPAALAAALRSVIESPERAASMVARGRARAAEFTWLGAAEQLWRLHVGLYQGAS